MTDRNFQSFRNAVAMQAEWFTVFCGSHGFVLTIMVPPIILTPLGAVAWLISDFAWRIICTATISTVNVNLALQWANYRYQTLMRRKMAAAAYYRDKESSMDDLAFFDRAELSQSFVDAGTEVPESRLRWALALRSDERFTWAGHQPSRVLVVNRRVDTCRMLRANAILWTVIMENGYLQVLTPLLTVATTCAVALVPRPWGMLAPLAYLTLVAALSFERVRDHHAGRWAFYWYHRPPTNDAPVHRLTPRSEGGKLAMSKSWVPVGNYFDPTVRI